MGNKKPAITNESLTKLSKTLHRNVGQAIADFNMIEDGDKIMVCVSGGKDSYTLLDILISLRKKAPINFEIIAVNLDQKQPGFPEEILPQYLRSIDINFEIIEEDTYSIVKDKIPEGKTTCSLCSRLRRGIIYNWAEKNNITKIALGHHRDDMIETLFLNMFFGGKLKSMPAKLRSDDGRNTIIRPLAYAKESDIEKYSQLKNFPIIPCNLCGSQENLQRKQVKIMLRQWEEQYPNRIQTIFRSMSNVAPSHLLDTELFSFADLGSTNDSKNTNQESETLFDASPVVQNHSINQNQEKIITTNI
ncbi:MAG: tRNA 2-thiocytidine(32) synthetase TtcA [Gammaproteobacteria bacterium]|nr:MAG: tRNA 2-thiocytidine(32) synthetase TtcA [Gammaproteobacteria bacterium]